MKIKKFKAKPSKSNSVKKVKLKNGEVEVFECNHCKFVDSKKKRR